MPQNLTEIIRTKIRAEGSMTLADFMALALTHPQYGYYTTRDPLGAEGDFTTAPEMTQAFGEIVGLWCIEAWKSIDSPPAFSLVELGPGRGTLMNDALRAAARIAPDFVAAAKIHLVEASPHLRARQAKTLGQYNPVWIDKLPQLPNLPCITLANEFFDAMPIRQFVRVKDAWMEKRIGLDIKDNLAFILTPALDAPSFEMPDESVVELCPDAPHLASAIARPIVRNRGAALIIDYGDEEVIGETLQAVSNHRQAHILTTPGFADITAHVSFAPLATAMRKIGCHVYGPVPQGEWLLGLGLRQRTEQLCLNATEAQKRSLEAALRRLTDPKGMGGLFKVIAATDRSTPPPPGFEE